MSERHFILLMLMVLFLPVVALWVYTKGLSIIRTTLVLGGLVIINLIIGGINEWKY